MKISKIIRFLFIPLLYVRIMRNEKWLPIIDESGKVYGRIAHSQSKQMKNKYLHPVVRIALVHNGKVFLRATENIEATNKSCLDYPFERHVFYKETVDKAVSKTFQPSDYQPGINCNYLFRYVHHSEEMQRMVYFYVCNIRDDNMLKNLNLSDGKWWTRKQIKENLNTGLFSGFFENEFGFLESTVLAVG